MATIADFSIAAEDFALSHTIESAPDVSFDVVRLVAHDDDRVFPLLWVYADAFDAVEDAMVEDTTVDDVELLTDLDGERLYRMEWTDRVDLVIYVLVDHDGTILNAATQDGRWHLRVLFPTREALSATYEFCRESAFNVEVGAIYEMDDSQSSRYGLTDDQYETLRLALEAGYYDVPRSTTMDELASEIGISHQSLSERLRRAHRNVLEYVIAPGFEN
ncbi:helix-turn-helix domain-containing protein [Natronorarus salvus]|uniref:helix-turn-helix domain-containing protein n=1 Tax=Natronorarus salvus TaxID=3117733 RepID=UPI002F26AE12